MLLVLLLVMVVMVVLVAPSLHVLLLLVLLLEWGAPAPAECKSDAVVLVEGFDVLHPSDVYPPPRATGYPRLPQGALHDVAR